MHPRRRHHAPLVVRVLSVLLALPLAGAQCLDDVDPGAERKECEDVCAIEGACELGRTEAECLAALCDVTGFRTFEEPAGADAGVASVDLQDLTFIACAKAAEDCAELALCSCPDSCARVDDCTGSPEAGCVDTCENLLEQDPSLYEENRCKMESTCADLAVCGSVSG